MREETIKLQTRNLLEEVNVDRTNYPEKRNMSDSQKTEVIETYGSAEFFEDPVEIDLNLKQLFYKDFFQYSEGNEIASESIMPDELIRDGDIGALKELLDSEEAGESREAPSTFQDRAERETEEASILGFSDETVYPKQPEPREEAHASLLFPVSDDAVCIIDPSNNGHTLPETSSLGIETEAKMVLPSSGRDKVEILVSNGISKTEDCFAEEVNEASSDEINELEDGDQISEEKLDIILELNRLYMKIESTNHYFVLGVSPNASLSEIKSAYLNLAKKFYLADNQFFDDENWWKAEAVFVRISSAYEVLGNAEKRTDYHMAEGQA